LATTLYIGKIVCEMQNFPLAELFSVFIHIKSGRGILHPLYTGVLHPVPNCQFCLIFQDNFNIFSVKPLLFCYWQNHGPRQTPRGANFYLN